MVIIASLHYCFCFIIHRHLINTQDCKDSIRHHSLPPQNQRDTRPRKWKRGPSLSIWMAKKGKLNVKADSISVSTLKNHLPLCFPFVPPHHVFFFLSLDRKIKWYIPSLILLFWHCLQHKLQILYSQQNWDSPNLSLVYLSRHSTEE